MGVVMLGMAAKAEQAADDHLRSAAGSHLGHRRKQDAQAILQIRPINLARRDAVTDGLVD